MIHPSNPILVNSFLVDISVVIPVYNEEESIPELTEWITRVMKENSLSFEIIFVDDGSKDTSWEIITQEAAKNSSVQGIRFRRNYGKSAALNEGFSACSGRSNYYDGF